MPFIENYRFLELYSVLEAQIWGDKRYEIEYCQNEI